MEAAKTVASSCLGQENTLLRVVALHTLASCVDVLQNEFIPLLQQSVTFVSDALVDASSPKSQNIRLHNASLALATALVDRFPYLLSPKSFDSLVHALSKAAGSQSGSEAASSRAQFLSVVSARIPIKTLFETAERNWLDALRNGPSVMTFRFGCPFKQANYVIGTRPATPSHLPLLGTYREICCHEGSSRYTRNILHPSGPAQDDLRGAGRLKVRKRGKHQ